MNKIEKEHKIYSAFINNDDEFIKDNSQTIIDIINPSPLIA